MLYHCWLYAVPRTCNYNIQWVRDRGKGNLLVTSWFLVKRVSGLPATQNEVTKSQSQESTAFSGY